MDHAKGHLFEDIASSIHTTEAEFKAIKQEYNQDQQKVIQGLAEYLIEQQNTSKTKAKQEAEQLLVGKNVDKKKQIQILAKAIEKGYITDFKIDTPWHPEIWDNPKYPDTWPYQHTSIIAYSGQAKHIFFKKEAKRWAKDHHGGLRNPDSIFTQGYFKDCNNSDAIYLSFLGRAKCYPEPSDLGVEKGVYEGSVVLEAQIPTNWITCMSGTVRSLEMFKERFGSPEESPDPYDFKIENIKKVRDTHGNKHYSKLPLKFIKGVWDREQHPNRKYFEPLSQYYWTVKEDYPSRVPEPSVAKLELTEKRKSVSNKEQRIKSEFEHLLETADKFDIIKEPMRYIGGFNRQRASNKYDLEKAVEYLVGIPERHNESIEEFIEIQEENLSIQYQFDNSKLAIDKFVLKQPKEIEQSYGELQKFCKELIYERNEYLRKNNVPPKNKIANLEKKMAKKTEALPLLEYNTEEILEIVLNHQKFEEWSDQELKEETKKVIEKK